MNAKTKLQDEIKDLNETEAKWLLNLLKQTRSKQIEKRLLDAAIRGLFHVPKRIQKRAIEPVKGKGKLLSEIVIEDRR